MSDQLLKLTLPKGRIQEKVLKLLGQIGVEFTTTSRSYRPVCSDPQIGVKVLKPQNIATLVSLGRHDCGFTGLDWILEQEAVVEELLNPGFDPVRIVAAVPEESQAGLSQGMTENGRPMVVASEYEKLAKDYLQRKGWNTVFVRTYGATEALPPEDADMIVDNTSTGSTLRMNRLTIVDELMRSTTRFVCHPEVLENPWKKQKLDEMVMLMQSTLTAAQKVLLEMNVAKEQLEAVVSCTPAMRAPTVSSLYHEEGYAVKVAIPKKEVSALIPKLVQAGAKDILEYHLEKIV